MRDVLIIGIACAAALLLGAWLYFSGGPTESVHEGTTTFTIVDQGNESGQITSRENYRIKNQDELAELWRLLHGTGAPSNIDFTKNEVLAVFDGTHATGGYGVSVESVTDTAEAGRQVVIVHQEPGASCVTTDAITSPFEIIVLEKSAYPLSHEDRIETVDCN